MAKLEFKQNSDVIATYSYFNIANSKFENYACSSSIFNSAGAYVIITTAFSLVSVLI